MYCLFFCTVVVTKMSGKKNEKIARKAHAQINYGRLVGKWQTEAEVR